MLSQLIIKNYALIKNLELKPTQGLNIITGETGAGKSIMLGAIGLIMGNRADVKTLFDETQKCIIEGFFDIKHLNLYDFFEENELDYDNMCVIRREIAPNGKSRAFINDTPAALETLKLLGQNLIDIHSQHETVLLGNNAFQLKLLDAFAQNQDIFENYQKEYLTFRQHEKKYNDLKKDAAALQKEFDYNSFLLNELIKGNLENTNQTELEENLAELENAEELKKRLANAFLMLNNPEQSAMSLLKDANISLAAVAGLSEKYKVLKERLQSAIIEIQDITDEIEGLEDKIETDDNQVEILKDRLNGIYKLQTKHGIKSVAELIDIRENLQQKVDTVVNLEGELSKLENAKNRSYDIVINLAQRLSQSRTESIPKISDRVKNLLYDLGMADAVLKISVNAKNVGFDGADDIQFEFSANKGSLPKPLKEVASGGEFSRLMLAFKYILAEKKQLPTIIFDEIDTGISGEVALKVGKMLAEMATKMQVISITHLHQIAGKGHTHFFVYKDNSQEKTVSLMRKLNEDERILEVAKMIGGQNPSESAIKSAIEMLAID